MLPLIKSTKTTQCPNAALKSPFNLLTTGPKTCIEVGLISDSDFFKSHFNTYSTNTQLKEQQIKARTFIAVLVSLDNDYCSVLRP